MQHDSEIVIDWMIVITKGFTISGLICITDTIHILACDEE